jgi:hydroxylamine reductase
MAAYAEHAKTWKRKSGDQCLHLSAWRQRWTIPFPPTIFVALTRNRRIWCKGHGASDEANTSRFGNPEIPKSIRRQKKFRKSDFRSRLTIWNSCWSRRKIPALSIIPTAKCCRSFIIPLLRNRNFAGTTHAWWKQLDEFISFHGPKSLPPTALFRKSEEVIGRIFTTGFHRYPGCKHIEADANGKKIISEIIALPRLFRAR